MKNLRRLFDSDNFIGDLTGALSAMLVAFPAAIAFGLIIFSPLGPDYTSFGALAGILGTIGLGLLAPLFGGTASLITAPAAPAAAVLTAFVATLVKTPDIQNEMIPVYIFLVGFSAGLLQIIFSLLGGGKFIKYIPYPVVAGYLSGVGVLIFAGQLPKLIGVGKSEFWTQVLLPGSWNFAGICIGVVTMLIMVLAPKLSKKIPAAILALTSGVTAYWLLAWRIPAMREMEGNGLIVGKINTDGAISLFSGAIHGLAKLPSVDQAHLSLVAYTSLTLAVLLSIDTLKTCVVLDVLTKSRHDSNRELFGQGLGNMFASALFGIPGAGTMGATLVNLNAGGRTERSGFLVGVFALISFYLLLSFMSWVPVTALAGILIIIAYRMIDFKSFHLLTQSSTMLDFLVILSVVVTAVAFNLIAAAGVGVLMSIMLFVRDQIHGTAIRRKTLGNAIFSKKQRSTDEFKVLQQKGDRTAVVELQGPLFFGTTDQFFSEIRPILPKVKYLILDFERVRSVDYTACNILKQIATQVEENQGVLLLSAIPENKPGRQNIQRYLNEVGPFKLVKNKEEHASLDSALERVEEKILEEFGPVQETKILDLHEIKIFRHSQRPLVDALKAATRESQYKNGDKIFCAGEMSDEIYFIRQGNVRIQLAGPDGDVITLSTFKKGNFFGDMAFLDQAERSANAVALGDVSLYIMGRREFDQCSMQHPEISALLFENLSKALSHRLRKTNIELASLR